MAFKYPWGNLQGLNLTWFINQFNKLREDWVTAEAGIEGSLDAEIQKAEDALSDVFDARDAAAASATAAAGSATQAGTSATAAQNSATAAASSATLANTKATAAGLSETNAAQSASQAALSATNAGNSATQASNSATAAGNSATAAAGSATQAGNSATAAAGSATAAATSETNAAASAQEAEDVLESIPADYSELSKQVGYNNDAISLNDKYLSQNLSDRSGTDGGVTWQLTGNTLTMQGTSTAQRVIVWSGSSSSVPAYAKNNTTYQIVITFSHVIEGITQRIQFRRAGSSSNEAEIYTTSGKYLFTTPEMLNFRIVTLFSAGVVIPDDYSITMEINNTIKEVFPVIATTIPDMVADTALNTNDFRIVNGSLYRITAQIPTGANLIPGTNCVKSVVCEVLKLLLNA